MKMMAGAGLGERAQQRKQRCRFLRGEHRGGLIEHQHPGAAIQCLQDFDALLAGDRQRSDSGPGVDSEAVLLPECVQRVGDIAQAREPGADIAETERDILGHRHRVDEHEMLVHHADAEAASRLRIGDRDRLAVDAELAAIGLDQAGEDAHQRGLAGAVLAEQGVNFARLDGKAHRIVGHDGAEADAHIAHFDGRRAGRRCA